MIWLKEKGGGETPLIVWPEPPTFKVFSEPATENKIKNIDLAFSTIDMRTALGLSLLTFSMV